MTFENDKVTAFGDSCKTQLPVINGKTQYCHRCLEEMAIRCAWCGKTIFIGDPVTLYSPKDRNQKPNYATLYSGENSSYIGCMRINCAYTGADRAGFWYPPDKVKRVPSLYGEALNCKPGEILIVNDLWDIEKAKEK